MNRIVGLERFKYDVVLIDDGVGRLGARIGFQVELDICRGNGDISKLYSDKLGMGEGTGRRETEDSLPGSVTTNVDVGQYCRETLAGSNRENSELDGNTNIRSLE